MKPPIDAPATRDCLHDVDLQDDSVQVWVAELADAIGYLPELRFTLSGAENARADRFAVDEARAQFIVGRACLRLVLGALLGTDARELEFSYEPHGKPFLSNPSPFAFNVSHSAQVVVVAVTRSGVVGVDVEKLRDDVSCAALAAENFCAIELERFQDAAPHDRSRAFFEHWVRKEAVAKAIGDGLGIPFSSICVTEDALRSPSARVRVSGGFDLWYTHRLEVDAGYVAAVATRAADTKVVVRPWRWSALVNRCA